jgi:hypothetical protein
MKITIGNIIDDQKQYADIVCRISWYFLPAVDQISEIELFSLNGSINSVPKPDDVPKYFRNSALNEISKISPKIKIVPTDQKNWELLLKERIYSLNSDNLLLITDEKSFPKVAIPGQKPIINITSVDQETTLFETSNYLFYLFKWKKTQERTDRYKKRFLNLKKICSWDKVMLLGSGPSLDDFNFENYLDFEFIPVNSIVKNKKLLEKTKPKIIIASDPVFHSGPSRYAEAFRENLIEAMNQYGSYFIFPLRDAEIYEYYLPKTLRNKLIGIPFNYSGSLNFNFETNFFVNATENVMTLFQLPIAAWLSDKIAFAGFDGRPREENNYFWKHSIKNQFQEEMENIKKCHHSFFERDYDKYIQNHSEQLKKYIKELENDNKFFENFTFSFIDCLESIRGKD